MNGASKANISNTYTDKYTNSTYLTGIFSEAMIPIPASLDALSLPAALDALSLLAALDTLSLPAALETLSLPPTEDDDDTEAQELLDFLDFGRTEKKAPILACFLSLRFLLAFSASLFATALIWHALSICSSHAPIQYGWRISIVRNDLRILRSSDMISEY